MHTHSRNEHIYAPSVLVDPLDLTHTMSREATSFCTYTLLTCTSKKKLSVSLLPLTTGSCVLEIQYQMIWLSSHLIILSLKSSIKLFDYQVIWHYHLIISDSVMWKHLQNIPYQTGHKRVTWTADGCWHVSPVLNRVMMSRVVTSVWSFQHADIRHFVPAWRDRGTQRRLRRELSSLLEGAERTHEKGEEKTKTESWYWRTCPQTHRWMRCTPSSKHFTSKYRDSRNKKYYSRKL